MEREGMLVDQEVLRRLAVDMGRDLLKLEERLFDAVGEVFNPRSPQQVSKLLYTKLRLPKPTRSKSETATDEECLEFNRGRHEVVPLMLEYRSGHKTYSTYVMGLESTIWYDGRVHATYLIHGAVSRTSCTNPNIQNIPREGPIKDMFIAPEGWEILWLDFNQHEFRMVAVYSGDEWLKEVFATGHNLHKEMSRVVYGDDYTEEDYVHAKMVNFGLLFGREAYSLSLQMGNSVPEAQDMINAFFERMSRVRTWQEEVVSGVFKGEDLISKLGRYRRFGIITHQNIKHVKNEILNFYPQATGSDTALMAGQAVQEEIADPSWLRPVAFVHDAIGYYIRKGNRGRIPDIIEVLERVPQEALNTDVTFKVDAKIGESWGSLKDLVLE
jgi:DNA polymerase-1